MQNIWQKLPKPILALAPMDDVTDTAFRQLVRSTIPYNLSTIPLFFTEFVNTDDIVHRYSRIPDQKLKFTPAEKPLIVQIWGNKPENYYKAAKQLVELGFDGIDINMGCPDKNVMKQCGGSGMIRDPKLAQEVIHATKDAAGSLPVSVKTRIGINQIQTEEWIGFLLDQDIAALTVHARTAAEMSKVPAHWEEFAKVVQMRNQKHKNTIILGNGDIESITQARQLVNQYGIDGVMIGRGIFKNFWVFDETKSPETASQQEKMKLLEEHVQLFLQNWGETKNFHILRKYFKIYMTHFNGAKEILRQLMETENEEEIKQILSKFDASISKNY
jgi:nifR3 family TIM-barrel protein